METRGSDFQSDEPDYQNETQRPQYGKGTSSGRLDSRTLITLKSNRGKGVAIRTGLSIAKYNSVLIFDSDLEIPPPEIKILSSRTATPALYLSDGMLVTKDH